ncbi:MAG TPA: NUDIX hydrolase N-terminal domain-containing protein, partial [Stellaceae bacterium]|nr:NUDIX hydrolase N-terminal domain-containing protein [Stellaceae bacterium]
MAKSCAEVCAYSVAKARWSPAAVRRISSCSGGPMRRSYAGGGARASRAPVEVAMEPNWLLWGRELAAIAQTGLVYAADPFDRERYRRVQAIAARMLAEGAGAE